VKCVPTGRPAPVSRWLAENLATQTQRWDRRTQPVSAGPPSRRHRRVRLAFSRSIRSALAQYDIAGVEPQGRPGSPYTRGPALLCGYRAARHVRTAALERDEDDDVAQRNRRPSRTRFWSSRTRARSVQPTNGGGSAAVWNARRRGPRAFSTASTALVGKHVASADQMGHTLTRDRASPAVLAPPFCWSLIIFTRSSNDDAPRRALFGQTPNRLATPFVPT
jgi:hypothetical protein